MSIDWWIRNQQLEHKHEKDYAREYEWSTAKQVTENEFDGIKKQISDKTKCLCLLNNKAFEGDFEINLQKFNKSSKGNKHTSWLKEHNEEYVCLQMCIGFTFFKYLIKRWMKKYTSTTDKKNWTRRKFCWNLFKSFKII